MNAIAFKDVINNYANTYHIYFIFLYTEFGIKLPTGLICYKPHLKDQPKSFQRKITKIFYATFNRCLFLNCTSTIMGNLMPNTHLQKNSRGLIESIGREFRGLHTFLKDIILKVNIIAQLKLLRGYTLIRGKLLTSTIFKMKKKKMNKKVVRSNG